MDYRIISLSIATFFYLSLCLLVVLKGVRSVGKAVYGFHLVNVIIWTFGIAMFHQVQDLKIALFWTDVLYLGGSNIATTFLHFSYTFPTGTISIPRHKQYLLYLPNIILFVLFFFTPIIVKEVGIYNNSKFFIYGPGHILWDIQFDSVFFIAFWRFYKIYRKSSGIEKMRLRYINLGTLLAVIFAGITNVIMPWFRCDFIWLGPCLALIAVACIVYAITQYHLMDITLVLRGGLVYLPYFLILTLISVPILILVHNTIWMVISAGIGLIIMAPVLYNFLRKHSQALVDEVIFGGKYSYIEKLEEFIDGMPFIPGEKDLFTNTVKTTTGTLGVKKVAIFTFDSVSDDYRLRDQLGLDEEEGFSIPADNGIVSWLKKNKEVFVKEEMEKILGHSELEPIERTLNKLGASVCVPAMLKEDLIGIITFGEKSSGDMYSHIDTRILHRLGTQFAVALDYKRIEAELRKKQEYAAIGQLAFEITHEMKNLLVPIRTFLDLVPDKINDPGFMNDFRRIAITHVAVIDRKVEDILYFGKNQVLKLEKDIDLNQILKDTVTALSPMANEKNIPIEEEYNTLPRITADSELLIHVFNNLVINAIDAMEGRTGKIRVRTMVNPNPTGQMQQLSQKWIRIEVKDDGSGIPPELKEKVFDAFVTTKHFGETLRTRGVGLGLTVVKKILDLHHGTVGVNSAVGKGSTFAVDLPADLKKE